jgi:hypothetical protein
MSSQQHTDAKSSITKSAMPTAPRWVAWIAGVVGVALCALVFLLWGVNGPSYIFDLIAAYCG